MKCVQYCTQIQVAKLQNYPQIHKSFLGIFFEIRI